jgi:hypothetical protein
VTGGTVRRPRHVTAFYLVLHCFAGAKPPHGIRPLLQRHRRPQLR